MTREEAINILETNAINATGVLGGLPQTAAEKSSLNQQIEALNMAIDALEKQIPKEPLYEADGYANGELVYDIWICPNCDNHFEVDYDDYDFCPDCGQAIDWSEHK